MATSETAETPHQDSLDSFRILRRAEDDPKGICYSRGESEPVSGRHREGKVRVRPGKAFTVRAAPPRGKLSTLQMAGGGGLRECPVPGMAEAEVAGPPRRVSASNEQESERPLLIKTLTLQTVLKVEILLEGFLTSRSQVIIGTGMDEVRSSYRRGEAPRSQEFPFVWSGV